MLLCVFRRRCIRRLRGVNSQLVSHPRCDDADINILMADPCVKLPYSKGKEAEARESRA